MNPIPKITALNQWYGSARLAAPEEIGAELTGCAWVGIPCGGGLPEIPYITARSLLVGDLHRHMINLARVVRCRKLQPALFRALKRTLFHPDELKAAQMRCRRREELADDPDSLYAETGRDNRFETDPDLDWSIDYFIASWMGQGGRAGTKTEFDGGLSFRRNANGGGSSRRFHSAIESLVAWRRCLSHCEFVVQDIFEFLAKIKDAKGLGIYIDSPWVGDGDIYKFPFNDTMHRRLARDVTRFTKTRLVIRHGDGPLVRELYPPARFNLIDRTGRTRANEDKPEVLILNGPSRLDRQRRTGEDETCLHGGDVLSAAASSDEGRIHVEEQGGRHRTAERTPAGRDEGVCDEGRDDRSVGRSGLFASPAQGVLTAQ